VEHDETIEVLRAITTAFDEHDLDGILAHFADDAVFESPRGPDPWGQRYVGIEQIREGFAGRFSGIPTSATRTTTISSTAIEARPNGPCPARRRRVSGSKFELRFVDASRRQGRQEGLVLEDPHARIGLPPRRPPSVVAQA
jgi:ketosteroid isomerase-like protein